MANTFTVTLTLEMPAESREALQQILDTVTTYDLIEMATSMSEVIENPEKDGGRTRIGNTPDNDKEFMCQNCSTLYSEDELNPITDVLERVAPGETMPWGECPDEECGAVCYKVEPEPQGGR